MGSLTLVHCCVIHEAVPSIVQAADFLDDKATVTDLCARISDHLFAPLIRTGERQVDAELENIYPDMHVGCAACRSSCPCTSTCRVLYWPDSECQY